MNSATNTTPVYSFDGACEAVRSVLSASEADALIDAAIEQMNDTGSARALAVEFGLDEHWGIAVATAVVDGLQN